MRLRILFLALWLVANSTAQADSFAVYARQSSTFYSEPAPLKLYDNDLKGGNLPDYGENAITFNRVEVGVAYSRFEVAAFWREDYAFHFTSDTFQFIYRDKNKLPFETGSYFDIDMTAMHIKGRGLQLAYKHDEDWGFARLALNYLQAESLLYGRLYGEIFRDNGTIRGNLDLAYFYEEDYVLKRKNVEPASGEGVSVDFSLQLALSPSTQLNVDFFDVLGKIHWSDAPYTELRVNTAPIYTTNNNGQRQRLPYVSGKAVYQSMSHRYPRHHRLILRQNLLTYWGVIYEAERYEQVVFHRAFIDYAPLKSVAMVQNWGSVADFTVKLGYDFTANAVWYALGAGPFSLQVASDDLSLATAKSLMVKASLGWRF